MDKKKVEFIESYIKNGNGDYQWNDNHGELVRCKDCKHFNGYNCVCDLYGLSHFDEYFCADGEKECDKE